MISIRKISKTRNKRKGGLHITNTIESNTIRSMAIDSKYFYDMNYIRFQSGKCSSSKYSSRFKFDKRDGISYVRCKDTIRRTKGISINLHDYAYTATGDSIPALSKYLERRRKS